MPERDEARESPNVRQLIDRYLEEHGAKLAMRNRDDQASMLRKPVEPAWGPRKAAGIQAKDIDKLLRHTFASLLVSGGMTLPMIGKLLGHRQVQATQRYAHLFDDPLRAQANRIWL